MPSTHGETPLKRYRIKYTLGAGQYMNHWDTPAVSIEAAEEAFDAVFSEMSSDIHVEYVVQLD